METKSEFVERIQRAANEGLSISSRDALRLLRHLAFAQTALEHLLPKRHLPSESKQDDNE